MLQEDYLIRMLRPLSAAVATLLQIRKADTDEEKKGAQYEDALIIVDRTAQQLIGMNALMINQLDAKSLLDMLGLDSLNGASKCLALAYLLQEEGNIYGARDNEEDSYHYYIKALRVYFEVLRVKGIAELRDHCPEIDTILEKLDAYELPADVQTGLFRYYEVIGKYDKAEDTLFNLIDSASDDRETVIEEGIAFYKRLREESDGQLIAGNLPRREVEAGLRELRDMETPGSGT